MNRSETEKQIKNFSKKAVLFISAAASLTYSAYGGQEEGTTNASCITDLSTACALKRSMLGSSAAIDGVIKVLCEERRKEFACDKLFKTATPNQQKEFYTCDRPDLICSDNVPILSEGLTQCASGVAEVMVDAVKGFIAIPNAVKSLFSKSEDIPRSIDECQDGQSNLDVESRINRMKAFRPQDMSDDTIRRWSCGQIDAYIQEKLDVIL